jgi:DNA modification methylase
MRPYYDRDGITIYNADCRDVLPSLGSFDLLLTDPPYGINVEHFRATLPETKGKSLVRAIAGDGDIDAASWLFSIQQHWNDMVVWGANNFPHVLPHKGRWICWDKRLTEDADKMLGSAFELAWTNKTSGFDAMIRVLHGGVVNSDRGKRFHPTQKPVLLFRKILTRYPSAMTIVDPFMGSGTTLIAAKLEGRSAVGIEIDERYCEIAAERLRQRLLF